MMWWKIKQRREIGNEEDHSGWKAGRMMANLNTVFREGSPKGSPWGKACQCLGKKIPGQKGSKAERPWGRSRLGILWNSKEASIPGAEQVRGRLVGDEVRVAVGFKVRLVSRSDRVLQALGRLWSIFWIWWEAVEGIWAVSLCLLWIEYQARADSHIPSRRSLQEPEERELNVLDQALVQDVLGAWIGGWEEERCPVMSLGYDLNNLRDERDYSRYSADFWWRGMGWRWEDGADAWVRDASLMFKRRWPKGSWIYWAGIHSSGLSYTSEFGSRI